MSATALWLSELQLSHFLFWGFAFLIAYVYFGYPVLLTLIAILRKKSVAREQAMERVPSVSVVIAARNEEKCIGRKIENSLALEYPRDKLEIIVASDGSVDRTADIARQFVGPNVSLVDLPRNVGKASAQNEAVKEATGDIILFTDAEAFLDGDALARLAQWFGDPTVGCVTGKVVYTNTEDTSVSRGEGAYWRYELFLRDKESGVGNLAMGSGAILAVRRGLSPPIDPDVSDDFVLPMQAAITGLKTIYEPRALCRIRLGQAAPDTMFGSKVRTIILDTRGLLACRALLNPLRYPRYAWGLVSHKLLRWLVPYFLIVLFVVNLLLLGQFFYDSALVLQAGFYLLAMAGYLWQKKGNPSCLFSIPFSFCLVNLAALVGVARFAMGKKSGRWHVVR